MKTMILILMMLGSLQTKAGEIRVGFLGLTMHGEAPKADVRPIMPRKLDNQAIFVWHPELNINYITDENTIYNATYVKDCTDNDAYYLGMGKQYNIEKGLRFGYIIGVYKRLQPYAFTNYDTGKITYTFTNQYLPMPQVFIEKVYKINEKFGISFQASSSIFLSHATIGFVFGGE